MRLLTIGLTAAALLLVACATQTASAGGPTRTHNDLRARRFALGQPWHGPYVHQQYGTPVALVVPPTASMQTQWSWGVSQTRVMPTYHQFGRHYPGPGGFNPGALHPTPAWPSHTDQFGVYYVRGPW